MFVFCKDKIKNVNLICDKPNKWAGHTNWGKNTTRLKNGELQETSDITEEIIVAVEKEIVKEPTVLPKRGRKKYGYK
jgi:hypothetical protein